MFYCENLQNGVIYLPNLIASIPPTDAPTSPPSVNMDTMVDQRRVRTCEDISVP